MIHAFRSGHRLRPRWRIAGEVQGGGREGPPPQGPEGPKGSDPRGCSLCLPTAVIPLRPLLHRLPDCGSRILRHSEGQGRLHPWAGDAGAAQVGFSASCIEFPVLNGPNIGTALFHPLLNP